MRKQIFGLALLAIVGCKGDGGSLENLLCGSSHAKGKMTLGLNFDFFKQSGFVEESGTVTDGSIQEFLNDIIGGAGVKPDILNVEKVESVVSNDKFRFLQLGGSFAGGFGIATGLLKEAIEKKFNLTEGDRPFDFINESFKVNASYATQDPDFDEIGAWFKRMTLRTISMQPNQDQWAFRQTEYEKAKELYTKLVAKYGKKDIVVAVLDTGVDLQHSDLKDILVEGFDALGTSTGAQDENGHGTHCAGIIAAQKNSEASALGVATMAGVKIMPVKVLGKDGGGDFQAIEKGLRWASDRKADVISMSLGAGLEYKDLKENQLANAVMADAINKGSAVIVAAGNEACPIGGNCTSQGFILSKKIQEYTVLPCSYAGSICVGATSADESLANYSNYASGDQNDPFRRKVDVNAPGTAIYSTWPTQLEPSGFKTISGTSMATPYIAGVVAILKSINQNQLSLSQDKIASLLKTGQAYSSEVQEKSKEGRVDLYATLVAFANELGFEDVEPSFQPQPNPVSAPEMEGGSGSDPIAVLWSSICQ